MVPDKAEHVRLATVAALLKELRGTQGWACYTEALRDCIAGTTERMIQGTIPEFEYLRGRIHGMRDALTLPDLLIQRAK